MSIKEWQMYHGAALSIIINEREYQAITKLPNHTRSEYMLNNDKGLYIKQASEDEDNPNTWRFTFNTDHQHKVRSMADRFTPEKTYIILVCVPDGICILNYGQYAVCLDVNYQNDEWLEVTRPDGRRFRVRGAGNNAEPLIIPQNAFPKILLEN